LTANRRLSSGLLIKAAYTYSKAIDMADDDGRTGLLFNWTPMLPRNEAPAGFDIRHNVQAGWVWELPFGPSKAFLAHGMGGRIFGGWQINGTVGWSTGVPFTVTASGASLNAPANTQTADQVKADVVKLGGIGTGQPYYDPTAFAPVRDVRFGTTGRNILRAPAVFNTNLSLFRAFAIGERLQLQARGESYNFTNTPHFGSPSANVSSGNFLVITSANQDQRQFRLGLRLSF
jgi:hypothetical protein